MKPWHPETLQFWFIIGCTCDVKEIIPLGQSIGEIGSGLHEQIVRRTIVRKQVVTFILHVFK
jgi:hypothetical protein